MRRKRILHLVTSLKVGGVAFWLLRNLKHMDPSRYEHLVCSFAVPRGLEAEFANAGFEPLVLGHDSGISPLRTLGRLMKTIGEHSIDLIQTNLLHL